MLLPSPSLLPLLLLSLALPTLAQQDSNSSTSAEYTSDSSFRDAVLDVTNTYRKQHNATGLSWNETLAEFAADWAGECGFVHSVSVVFWFGFGGVWEGALGGGRVVWDRGLWGER